MAIFTQHEKKGRSAFNMRVSWISRSSPNQLGEYYGDALVTQDSVHLVPARPWCRHTGFATAQRLSCDVMPKRFFKSHIKRFKAENSNYQNRISRGFDTSAFLILHDYLCGCKDGISRRSGILFCKKKGGKRCAWKCICMDSLRLTPAIAIKSWLGSSSQGIRCRNWEFSWQ